LVGLPWLKENFGWSKSTAENYMNAYEAFGKFPTGGNLDINIDAKALYLLSGNGVIRITETTPAANAPHF
jgi:hypothetical protein